MAKQSWHDQPFDLGVAKGSARDGAPKRLTPLVTHPSMKDRTSTTLGAPPTGELSDASSALPTDPIRQHSSKKLPVPKCHPGTPSRDQRGQFDPKMATDVFGDAVLSGSTRLPESTSEET